MRASQIPASIRVTWLEPIEVDNHTSAAATQCDVICPVKWMILTGGGEHIQQCTVKPFNQSITLWTIWCGTALSDVEDLAHFFYKV